MRLEEHPTPWTDRSATYASRVPGVETVVRASFARDLERRLRAIHALVEGCADGTIDATPYEKLCNEIAELTGITL